MKAYVDPAARREVAEPIGLMVRTIAKRQGVTLTRLAEVLHVSQQSLHQKLRGDAPLEVLELTVMANELGVSRVELLRAPEELWAARDSNPEPAGGGRVARIYGLCPHSLAPLPIAA